MRGEHAEPDSSRSVGTGSSPHARGAPVSSTTPSVARRIIPACAGSTSRPTATARRWGDHPRMRGEHSLDKAGDFLNEGSSPHARGAPGARAILTSAAGIIPACAGSTTVTAEPDFHVGDHPRMRGEHPPHSLMTDELEGSSPHARGAHLRALANPKPHGVIPACAGST